MAGLISSEKYSLYFQKVGLLYRRPEIKASLEIILSIFTVTILVLVAIRPTLTNIVQLQKKITDQELVNKKADNKIVQLFNAQKQINNFSSRLSLFDAAVPDAFSYTDSAKRIEYLARANNLVVDSMSFPGYALARGAAVTEAWALSIIKPSGANTLLDKVSFAVNGKPQEVVTFLREIEKMDRLATVESVTLTKQVGLNQAASTLKASGFVTFYFYSDQQ